VQSAIETLHAGRYELHNPTFLGVLAEGLAAMGRLEEASSRIDEAIARIENNGQLVFLPEFLRIKGTILAAGPQPDLHQAEDLFLRAIGIANRQFALAWELRAAIHVARLRIDQDRPGEARDILAPIYDRFTEGFDTADLKEGRALLDRLRPSGRLSLT